MSHIKQKREQKNFRNLKLFNFSSELEVSPPIDGLLFRVYVQKMLERIEAGLVHSSVMPLMMTSSRVAKNKFLWPIRSTKLVS